MPKCYTRYAPPPCDGIDFTASPSLAKQEFEAECNINNILAKFKVTGVLVDPAVRSLRQPMFLDCTSLPDLREYHDQLSRLQDSFEQLPRPVQEAFGFDARTAMQWLSHASDRQVVQLFKQLSSPPAGAGGAASPQNQQDPPPAAAASAATQSNDSPVEPNTTG